MTMNVPFCDFLILLSFFLEKLIIMYLIPYRKFIISKFYKFLKEQEVILYYSFVKCRVH